MPESERHYDASTPKGSMPNKFAALKIEKVKGMQKIEIRPNMQRGHRQSDVG
jgi:hypothetical protein